MSSRDKVVYVCEPGIILVQEGYAFLSNSVFILDPLPNNNRTVMGPLIFGGEGGIDSNRLKAILTPPGRTACVQNATAFCRTGFSSLTLCL